MTVRYNYNPLDKNSTPISVIDLTLDDKPIPDPVPAPSVTPQWTTSEDTKRIVQSISAVLDDTQLAKVAVAAGSDISAATNRQAVVEIILNDVLKTDSNDNISLTDTVNEVKDIINRVIDTEMYTGEVSRIQYESIIEFTTIIVDTVGEIAEDKQQIYSDPDRFLQVDDQRRQALTAAVAEGELEAVTQERDWAREELEGLGAPTYDPITGEPVSPFNIDKFIEDATRAFGELSEEEWAEIETDIEKQFGPIYGQLRREGFQNFLREEGIVDDAGKVDPYAFLERMNSMLTEEAGAPTTFIQLMIDTMRETLVQAETLRDNFGVWSNLHPDDKIEILDIVGQKNDILSAINRLEEINYRYLSPEEGGG
jgi:hypothetical protein